LSVTLRANQLIIVKLNFNGLVKLKFRKNNPEPEIIEMIPMNRGHLQQLKNRVSKTK
jgi:hypothetical protein